MDLGRSLINESIDRIEHREPLCVESETSVRRVFRLMRDRNRGSVFVCRDGVLIGIFTEHDAVRLMAAQADLDGPIQQVMTRDPVTLRPDEKVATAVASMSSHGYRHLPVVDAEGRPVGKIDVVDMIHWLVEHLPEPVASSALSEKTAHRPI